MSTHSYTRCWLHLIWTTKNQEKILTSKSRRSLSRFLFDYARDKGIYMKINYVNPDHVHGLIDLPTHLSIEEIFHLLKGSSSNWINQNDFLEKKFAWDKGYAVFSVSHSQLAKISDFIRMQEEYHWETTYQEEFAELLKRHELIIKK